MAKKQKSKARLDKYYYLAKEHGFRSRAAFKLIQLNKKYNFLGSANCLIDLCAAPGGWLQVAAKYMPVSSIKIGVDLDPIKPINGVTNFIADITSEKCRFLIKKEIKHFKADVVLNDGAPNVGGQWSKDAYNQSELVLFAVKLATEFLKEDGVFITKVFRSSDYNSLMYVLKQLFKKVEATKPQASRNESAEIFVVCQGYRAPAFIDNKLLDPKYALKQLEDEEDMKMNSIKSIKAMFEKKKHRGGYFGKLYNEKSFKDFIESSNPYLFLTEANKIKILTDDCKKYIEAMKCPLDYKLYFDDILILGKKEIQELIIWRNKIKAKLNKKEKVKEQEIDGEFELNEEKDNKTYKDKKLEEIDEELNEFEKARKKRMENDKKKREKNDMRMKMSFVNQQEATTSNNDVEFDQNLFEFIKKNDINIEELDYEEDKPILIPTQTIEEFDLSDLSEDDFIDLMDEDIEENRRLFSEKKAESKGKKEKREKKKKYEREYEEVEEKKISDGIDYVRNEPGNSDPDDDDEGEDGEDSILGSGEDNGELEDDSDNEFIKKEMKNIKSKPKIEEKVSENKNDMFENPLRKKKNIEKKNKSKFDQVKKVVDENNTTGQKDNNKDSDDENNVSSDTDDEGKKSKNKKKDESKLLGKKKKRQDETTKKTNNEEENNEIETVPKIKDSDDEDSEYDSDEKAEIRAIAKKMLRKKDCLDILYKTYNRYAFEDFDQAPDWFAEEELKHNKPSLPVTKEEILREKEVLREYNCRMPKKVLEAKARKKNKLTKRLDKVKKKAQTISNQDDINEFSKVKQIEKLYRKEISKSKEKKRYVVARSNRRNVGKNSRNVKFVDKRLKKDTRALKRTEKKNEKNGVVKQKRGKGRNRK